MQTKKIMNKYTINLLLLSCICLMGCKPTNNPNLAYYIEHPYELQADLNYCQKNVNSKFCENVFIQHSRYQKYKDKYVPPKTHFTPSKPNIWLRLDEPY